MSRIVNHTLAGGAILLIEPIAGVASTALCWRLPAGSALDAASEDGLAAMLSEIIFRGAGGLNSREHSDALDRLGVQRSSGVLVHHLQIDATLLARRLDDALALLGPLVRRPALDDDSIEPVRSLCRQSVESLDDNPQHMTMLRLRERHVDAPFNRHGYGTVDGLASVDGDRVRAAWATRFVPEGSILAVAGGVDPDEVIAGFERQFDGWTGRALSDPTAVPAERGSLHIQQDTAQVHIGVAFDAPRSVDPNAILERLAVGVLSGSTSGRLFTEVRQKRSLCYSVGAAYRGGRDTGRVALYAGTTPERAQETLDVCLAEIERMRAGVTAEELERAQVQLRSRIVMSGESTPARAGALAADWFQRGRTRTLEERVEEVARVKLKAVNDYLANRDFGTLTSVTLGPEALAVPDTVMTSVGGGA